MMIAGGVMLVSLMLSGASPAPDDDATPTVPIDGWIAPPEAEPPPTKAPPPGFTLAQPVAPPESALARLNHRWYGWQLVLADLSSFAIGHEAQTGRFADVATAGLIGAGPALHFAHGHWQRGVVSLVGRAAFVAAAVHYGLSWKSRPQQPPCPPPQGEFCLDNQTIPTAQALDQFAVLMAAAGFLILDDVVLSLRNDLPQWGGAPPPAATASFMPTVSPTAGGLAMGLVGRF